MTLMHSLSRKTALVLSLAAMLAGLAGCEGAAESHAAQALNANEAEVDAPDAPIPLPEATCAAELDALLAGPYSHVCGWEGLHSYCDFFDLSLEDIAAALGLLADCADGELCCHGTCVSYEDAEAHGC
jgi:hypothetical protein